MFNNWKSLLTISILFCCSIIVLAILTRQWVILSLVVGFLFGFSLQKGDLCGASAMSEILLMKDKEKIFGLWIAILTSMVLFAIFENIGIIQLVPKKLYWLSFLVGGIIFGIGTVLAGGCISGCLYKGATGNINSIAALLTIPLGISAVDYGPLQGFNKHLLEYVINDDNGNAITLHSLLGIPYWIIVAFLLIFTIIFGYTKWKKSPRKKFYVKFGNIFSKSWKPWQAGLSIGMISMLAWLSSLAVGRNYPLGITHGVSNLYQAIIEKNVKFIYEKQQFPSQIAKGIQNRTSIAQTQSNYSPPNKQVKLESRNLNVWLILLTIGVMFGEFVSGKMTGKAKLTPKEPQQTLIAMLGGLLVGTGAGISTGCIIGNVLSGWAMLSIGTFIFGVSTLLANWITTYFYLMGGTIRLKKTNQH